MTALKNFLDNIKAHVTSDWNVAEVQSEVHVSTFEVPNDSIFRALLRRLKPLVPNAWYGAIVGAAALLPTLTLLWKPLLGDYVTAVTLAVLLTLAITVTKMRKLAVAASVLPVATMVSLSLPTPQNVLARLSIQYGVLLLLGSVYVYLYRTDYPLKNLRTCTGCYVNVLPLMLIIGEALGAASFVILRHQYPYKGTLLPIVAAAVVAFAIAEELVFRGLIQRQAAKLMHPITAATITVFAYTVATIGTGSDLPLLFALLSGITLSAIYYFIPNLILTTFTNATMKLTYLGLVATFILR